MVNKKKRIYFSNYTRKVLNLLRRVIRALEHRFLLSETKLTIRLGLNVYVGQRRALWTYSLKPLILPCYEFDIVYAVTALNVPVKGYQ